MPMPPVDSDPPQVSQADILCIRLERMRANARIFSENVKEDGIMHAQQLLDEVAPMFAELARLPACAEVHQEESQLVAREVLYCASLAYIEIYCTREAWPRVRELKIAPTSAVAYERLMALAQTMSTDAGLLALLDSNRKLAQKLLGTTFAPPPPPPWWKRAFTMFAKGFWTVADSRYVTLDERDGCAVWACAAVVVYLIYKVVCWMEYIFKTIISVFGFQVPGL